MPTGSDNMKEAPFIPPGTVLNLTSYLHIYPQFRGHFEDFNESNTFEIYIQFHYISEIQNSD